MRDAPGWGGGGGSRYLNMSMDMFTIIFCSYLITNDTTLHRFTYIYFRIFLLNAHQ